MKFRMNYLVFFSLLTVSHSFAQQDCDLESYYNNPTIFRVDTIYKNVWIDGQQFTIKVLSDHMDEYLNVFEEDQVLEWNDAPKTLVFYAEENQKMVYAKKFDGAIPEIEKAGNDLTKAGRLYLRWFSSGGGSGFSLDSYAVYLDNGKIQMRELFVTNELSLIVHHKNDQEGLVLQGIWDMTIDEETGDFEAHFSEHKYEVFHFSFEENDITIKSLGITTNKYASLDEGVSVLTIMKEMQQKERILPSNLKLEEWIER